MQTVQKTQKLQTTQILFEYTGNTQNLVTFLICFLQYLPQSFLTDQFSTQLSTLKWLQINASFFVVEFGGNLTVCFKTYACLTWQ